MNFSIFVFSWNVQSVLYECKNNSNECKNNGNVETIHDNFKSADFIEPIVTKAKGYDIITIGLQEDSIRNSQLMTEFSKQIIKEEYSLLETIELSGWGTTTYKAMINNWEYAPRGLRLAVFVKNNIKCLTPKNTIKCSYVCPSVRDKITWGKGSVVIILNFTIENKKYDLAILNMHLPFYSKTLFTNELRKESLKYQEYCLKYLIDLVKKDYSPTDLIVFGDLNFRTTFFKNVHEKEDYPIDYAKNVAQIMINGWYSDFLHHDELLNSEVYKDLNFNEGIDGKGPNFLPTCKLAKNRNSTEYKLGKKFQRFPSWCDRILTISDNIKFKKYSHFDYGNMNLSDHAAVYAVLEFIV